MECSPASSTLLNSPVLVLLFTQSFEVFGREADQKTSNQNMSKTDYLVTAYTDGILLFSCRHATVPLYCNITSIFKRNKLTHVICKCI